MGQDFSSNEGKKVLKNVKEQILEAMISEQLVLQYAKDNNIYFRRRGT
ncbi:MAG: hypothetical protein ACOX2A_00700 [Tepidanaerobacteraceae bacterium]